VKKIILIVLGVAIVLFIIAQVIPLPLRGHNPPVTAEPQWDSPQTRALAKRACFDCHSNETVWPWYGYVAPVSWLLYRDVTEGRSNLNFSEWSNTQTAALEASEQVLSGEMPPWFYLPLHPTARLTPEERQQLATGLNNSLK
jgi:mono/diheme cytochrome c family protein